ncbi:MAG: tRNA threonylcarbamoyladenosine dehydratase [Alloprevotella sp.]|nr:MAG: tRNA threonylcarbamoyladenosine dehydratase [Alloprevotella sp.]
MTQPTLEQQIFHRSRLLMGDAPLQRLHDIRVILFGVGGVGSWCAESLVRSGVKHLTIVDSDRVNISNVNRQLMATTQTVGQVKVEVLKERLLSINPEAEITAIQDIYNAENSESFRLNEYDVIIDAIDSLAEKAHLLLTASRTDALLYSSMGAALKMDPTRIQVAEFMKVRGCPLGRALRKKMKHQKVRPAKKFLCVYSDEVLPNLGEADVDGYEPTIAESTTTQEGREDLLSHNWNERKAQINGTMSHITAMFGFMLAGLIVQHFYKSETEMNENKTSPTENRLEI